MGFRRWDKHDYDSDIEVDVKDLAPLVDHTPAKPSNHKPIIGIWDGISQKHTHDHD